MERNVEQLLDKYSDMVMRITFQIVKNRTDAEDVCQEVFLKLFSLKRVFESEEHQKAWLIRVAINKSKDLVKSSWFKKRAELTEVQAVYEDSHISVLEEVMKLPIKYRNVIYLHYYEGYSAKEISEILKCKENTVLSQLSRGRTKLKESMIGGFEHE